MYSMFFKKLSVEAKTDDLPTTLEFQKEGISYYISLERSLCDKNFVESSFGVWWLLKKLQGASVSILSYFSLGNEYGF